MSTRQKIIVTLAVGLTAFAVQADVAINVGSSGFASGRTVTLTETVADTLVISGSSGTFSATQQPTGSFTAAGPVGTFSATYNGYSDWDKVAGSNAMVNGTAGTYIGGLTGANVSFNNSSGVVGGSNNFYVDGNEAMVLTIDTSALNAGMQLNVKAIDFIVPSSVTMAVIDSSTDAIREVQWTGGDWSGDVLLNQGDYIILSNGEGDTGGFKLGKLSYDVIPEPATLGLVTAFGGGLLFLRRRFMI